MNDSQMTATQHVNFLTTDNVQIVGDYVPGTKNVGVVLLHMMPATKESFSQLITQLVQLGLTVLAIDLRGHGGSGGGDYQEFSHEQHQKSIFDVMAAVEFLKSKHPDMEIGLVGASIGANLALQYAAANPVKFLALLSAGLNYRGIETGRLVAALPSDLPVYFLSAQDDPRVDGNTEQVETLYGACSSQNKVIKILPDGGHGTDIINSDQMAMADLVDWFTTILE